MHRTKVDWVGRAFLVIFICCVGYLVTRTYVSRPRSDNVQWKIDRLKKELQRKEQKRIAERAVVLMVPRDTEGTVVRCLLTKKRTPILSVTIETSALTDNRCHVDLFSSKSEVMILCPASARRIARSCAASVQ